MQLLRIEWHDAHSEDGWIDPAKMATIESCECKTVGWLVGETPELLRLATTLQFGADGKIAASCMLLTIPKGCIRKVTTLQKAEDTPPQEELPLGI